MWVNGLTEAEADALRRRLDASAGCWLAEDDRVVVLTSSRSYYLVQLPSIVLRDNDWIADNTDASLAMGAMLDHVVSPAAGRCYPELRLATGYLYERGLVRLLALLKDHNTRIHLLFSGQTDHGTASALTSAFSQLVTDEVEHTGDSALADACERALREGRLAVRIYADTFLHAKVFLAYEEGYRGLNGNMIIGSSNLSGAGLGHAGNLELDVRVEAAQSLERVRDWFDARWDEADEPIPPLLQVVQTWRPTPPPTFETPGMADVWAAGRGGRLDGADAHLALIAGLYGDRAVQPGGRSVQPPYPDPNEVPRHITPSPEQVEGAQNLAYRLLLYRLGFLADSVGLGKTVTALGAAWSLVRSGVIQHFAVVAPRKLHHQWRADAGRIGMDRAAFETLNRHTLERDDEELAIRALSAFGLVIVDEAHEVLRSRSNKLWRHLRAWLAATPTAKLLLVSATPWNNSRDDIYNYLALAWADVPRDLYPGVTRAPVSGLLDIFTGYTRGGASTFRELSQEHYDQLFGAAFVQRTRTSLATRQPGGPEFPERRVLPESTPATEAHDALFATLNATLAQLSIPYREPFSALSRAAGDDSTTARAANLHGAFVLNLFKRAESSIFALAVSLATVRRRLRMFADDLQALYASPTPLAVLRVWLDEVYVKATPLPLDEGEPEQDDLLETAAAPSARRANADALLGRLTDATAIEVLKAVAAEARRDAAALDALFEHLTPAMDQGDPKLRILFTPVAMHLGAGHKPVLVASYADTAM
ncbi:MAG: hypothetical protein KC549_15485, partial [Myxococcales bacterium]|nr:hypothetical protein [Myxococcales bacterium]